jgi:hypothetical protein
VNFIQLARGTLEKMSCDPSATASLTQTPVDYTLKVGKARIDANALLGERLRLEYLGRILCRHCGRETRKSFNQGHCFPCFRKLASCDSCIVSPEKCHYHLGSCREPEWGESFCMQPHLVYLSNASGLKVGITRHTQVPTRWLDQGAESALPLYQTSSRYLAGLVEVAAKAHVSDRTNWRAMLKGSPDPVELERERERFRELLAPDVAALRTEYGEDAVTDLDDSPAFWSYPVDRWPEKVSSHNLEKHPVLEGRLDGIKGQYLIFDSGVINIRKYTAYEVTLSKASMA